MTSLRSRLLLGTGVGTAVVLGVAGTTLYALMRASLLREFDRALREKAATLAALIEQDGDEISLEFSEADMGEFRRRERPEYFQVWRADGTVVEKSPSLGRADLPRRLAGSAETTVLSVGLPNGDPGRAATWTFTPRLDDESPATAPQRLTIALARDTLDVDSSLIQLGLWLTVVGLSATLASAAVLAWLIRVGLQPVDQLADRISRVDERRLSAPIDATDTPRELRSIVARLNEMLLRLDRAFQREKTLTANVAHELRTPLAGIRSTLEVALSRERDWISSRDVMSQCLRICAQTQRIIESLLTMARLDAGTEVIHRERVDVGSLLRKAWTPWEALARQRGLNVRWEGSGDLHADTDPEKLVIVCSNILENAARYAEEGGTITINGHHSNGRLRVRVSNTGSRLSASDVTHIFDPFWRGDQARVATGAHSGLGLALCKMIVTQLGGEIQAESTSSGRFTVMLVV